MVEVKMRANEFLIEYKRDVTIQKLGQPLYQKMLNDKTVQRIYGDDPLQNIDPNEIIEFGIDRFQEADPTPNKQFVAWLVRLYAKDPTFKFEDVLSQVHPYLEKFYKLNMRKKIPSPRNDVNRYASFADFMGVMDEYPDPDQVELKDKGRAFTIYEDDNWRVIVPQDEAASCYYGQGTRWCTAATKANNMFDFYNSIAPILIAQPKNPNYPGERYQLHFGISIDDNPVKREADALDYARQSSDYADYDWSDYVSSDDLDIDFEYGQIMDERDNPVAGPTIITRMGDSWENMLNAYIKKFPKHRWQLEKNLEQLDTGFI
jgi:hypothetical protein